MVMPERYAMQVLIEPELRDRLLEVARAEQRTLSNLVRFILTSYLNTR